jgi:hypothetical protein
LFFICTFHFWSPEYSANCIIDPAKSERYAFVGVWRLEGFINIRDEVSLRVLDRKYESSRRFSIFQVIYGYALQRSPNIR